MTFPIGSIGNQFPTPAFVTNVDLHAKIDVPLDALRALFATAYSTYTPTLIQSAAVTKTVGWAHYTQLGKTCMGDVVLIATAVGTVSNSITSSLPVAPLYAAANALVVGNFHYIRASGARQSGSVLITGNTGLILFQGAERSNVLGQDPTTAIAIGDVLSYSFKYETA